jgi:hypothetical protein
MNADLPPEQQRALEALARVLDPASYYLGGGVAVALRLHHRRSVDLDFFTATSDPPALTLASVPTLVPQVPNVVRDRKASGTWGTNVVRDRKASSTEGTNVVRDRRASSTEGTNVVRDQKASGTEGTNAVRNRRASGPWGPYVVRDRRASGP